jgi:hypothetical protein
MAAQFCATAGAVAKIKMQAVATTNVRMIAQQRRRVGLT